MPPELGPNPGSKELLKNTSLFSTLEQAFGTFAERYVLIDPSNPDVEILPLRQKVKGKRTGDRIVLVREYSLLRPTNFAELNGQAAFTIKFERSVLFPPQAPDHRGKMKIKYSKNNGTLEDDEFIVEHNGTFKLLGQNKDRRIPVEKDYEEALARIVTASDPREVKLRNPSSTDNLARAS